MNILCKLFGHKSSEHDYSGGEYMRLARGAIDGVGREHATLYARCPRCEKKYRAGQIHLIQRECDRVAISAQADARDAGRWRMASLIHSEMMKHPDIRAEPEAASAYMKAVHDGVCFEAAIDSAIAAAKGE